MKILIIAGKADSLINFRGPLLKALTEKGHEVHVAAPYLSKDLKVLDELEARSIKAYDIQFDRTGLNPFSDVKLCANLYMLMRTIKPEIVLSYTIKPVIWGMIAAKLSQVPNRFALITGLGYAFTGKSTSSRRVIRWLARRLYKKALGFADKVFFQNPDDNSLFREMGILSKRTPSVVVNGSGVDLLRFSRLPVPSGNPSFLMIARLLGDKGIREYVTAAGIVKEQHPNIQFHLVGGLDANPDSVSEHEVETWVKSGSIVYHGHQPDVKPFIERCHVFVLPSYREGTPRTTLEAMACGRAIITTDVPGCRETVNEGYNGLLVPPMDPIALAEAMRSLIIDPSQIVSMSHASFALATSKYDVHKVNATMLSEMDL